MIRLALAFAFAFVLALALPAAGLAAAKAGSYSGSSSGKVYAYQELDGHIDKGKVTFTVRSNAVVKLRLTGQEFQCGASPGVVKVAVAKIKLSSSGSGTASYTDPNVGKFKIAITVTSKGRATGKITPQGLCNSVVKFSAKRG